MTQTEKSMTVDLPDNIAEWVDNAVRTGEYASSSDVVREALTAWAATRIQAHAALKADISRGLDDIAQGRLHDFSEDRIIEQGRIRLAAQSRSA